MKKKKKMVFRVLKAFVLIIKLVKDIQHQNKSSDLYFRKEKKRIGKLKKNKNICY